MESSGNQTCCVHRFCDRQQIVLYIHPRRIPLLRYWNQPSFFPCRCQLFRPTLSIISITPASHSQCGPKLTEHQSLLSVPVEVTLPPTTRLNLSSPFPGVPVPTRHSQRTNEPSTASFPDPADQSCYNPPTSCSRSSYNRQSPLPAPALSGPSESCRKPEYD